MKKVLVAFYLIPEIGPDSVETPIIGNPAEEYKALEVAIYKRHPKFKRGELKKFGSVIEIRDETNPGYIEPSPGMTIRQLFEEMPPDATPQRQVGRTFFCGSPFNIMLIYTNGGHVKLALHPRLKGDGVVNFSNQISAQRLVAELPALVTEVLGKDARDTQLLIRLPVTK